MIHLEQARVLEAVNRLEAMRSKLRQYAAAVGTVQRVSPGALVETTGPWVLVGVPLGKVQLPNALVLCVGAEAPLAQQWHGAQPGDQVALGPQNSPFRPFTDPARAHGTSLVRLGLLQG